jgi:molecular chaperone HtpG
MTDSTRQETLRFQTETKQLLDIVIHSLYSNKEIFLRELNSNASDAADKLRFEALSDPALYESDSDLKIKISFDEKARTITVSDNGIGMSREEVVDHLGTIAKSGTRDFMAKLTGDQKKDAHLIGQFGVGFYSAFIVADKVSVLTRRAGLTAEHGVRWESKGDGEYTIENTPKESRGTDIILHLREGADEFLSDWRLRAIISKYSDHITLPIQMLKPETTEWETVNSATALWTLPKNAIEDEQYKDLYKHIAHDFEDPLAWSHNKVEGGNLDYISLLYIPAHAPQDLWQRERQRGLKLYVQRVFIMDQVDQFLPIYLRFVRGILDTHALPLNISRELLQDNPAIPRLRSAIVKRVLDLLEKLAKEDPEKYAKFWKEFGPAIKEGPAEDFANREQIAKLLRFSSTHTDLPQQTVSLDDYVKRMKPDQKKIYYISADSFTAAKSSPQLEIFRKNNIEVLLMYDRVDEWMVAHLAEIDKKPLQSVAKGDISLEELGIENKETKAEIHKQDEESKTEFDPIIQRIKTVLGDQVKEVRLSHRLTNSPVCLVSDQNDLSLQFQRMLKSAGQEIPDIKPIFEINPHHKLILKLKAEISSQQFTDWTQILFDQAILAEGGQLKDPATYVQRVNQLLIQKD